MYKESLGSRMKRYEESTNFHIIPRVPIMIRIDGKSFSKLTKKLHLNKPYDENFSRWMSETAICIASEIQGCMLGYVQSDEMTFAIRSDQTNKTTPWFDNRIQKIISVAASISAAVFNNFIPLDENNKKVTYAFFDCRVWPMPSIIEVFNNFIWRQIDCTKNSISSACYYEVSRMLGRGTTRKLMYEKNQDEQQELLFSKANINWNNYSEGFKRGFVIFRESISIITENGEAERKRWVYKPAPIFTREEGKDWLFNILDPKTSC